jgi:hypothetical protein
LKKHKGDWLFCAVAANGTKAFVQVDAKRRVEKKVVEDLKNHVGGSAQKVRGICNVKGNKLVFYLSKNAKKKPQKVHINNGLKDQIKDKVYKVEDVFFTLDEVPESKSELNAVVKQLKQGE